MTLNYSADCSNRKKNGLLRLLKTRNNLDFKKGKERLAYCLFPDMTFVCLYWFGGMVG